MVRLLLGQRRPRILLGPARGVHRGSRAPFCRGEIGERRLLGVLPRLRAREVDGPQLTAGEELGLRVPCPRGALFFLTARVFGADARRLRGFARAHGVAELGRRVLDASFAVLE